MPPLIVPVHLETTDRRDAEAFICLAYCLYPVDNTSWMKATELIQNIQVLSISYFLVILKICFKKNALKDKNVNINIIAHRFLAWSSSMRVGLASQDLWVACVTADTSSFATSVPFSFCNWPYAGWLMSRTESTCDEAPPRVQK